MSDRYEIRPGSSKPGQSRYATHSEVLLALKATAKELRTSAKLPAGKHGDHWRASIDGLVVVGDTRRSDDHVLETFHVVGPDVDHERLLRRLARVGGKEDVVDPNRGVRFPAGVLAELEPQDEMPPGHRQPVDVEVARAEGVAPQLLHQQSIARFAEDRDREQVVGNVGPPGAAGRLARASVEGEVVGSSTREFTGKPTGECLHALDSRKPRGEASSSIDVGSLGNRFPRPVPTRKAPSTSARAPIRGKRNHWSEADLRSYKSRVTAALERRLQ